LRRVSRYLERLHDLIIVWLAVILIIVVFIRFKVIIRLKGNLLPDSELLEKTWTIIPIFILLRIAYPRIYLLCLQDSRNQSPANTIKVVRNQWNWQRETSDDNVDILLDADRIDLLAAYEYPVLSIIGLDNRVITIRTDVLHSLGLPSIGIKLDAAPGRISLTVFNNSKPGLIIGSCYELCGRGHSAIPISILTIRK
jgi:cytochrome c oxidase subunit 2